jgi:hypothetical protein
MEGFVWERGMRLVEELRRLAEVRGWGGPVVSVYVGTRWVDEVERERLRIFWNEQRRELLRRGADEGVLVQLGQEIDSLTHALKQTLPVSVAFFAGPKHFERIPIACRVQNSAYVGARPRLIGLAQANTDCERVLVATVGAKSSRIYELRGNDVDTALDLGGLDLDDIRESNSPGSGNPDGHELQHLQLKMGEVSRKLAGLFDLEACRVIVSGPRQVAALLFEHLPKRVQTRTQVTASVKNHQERPERQAVQELVARTLEYVHLGEAVDLEKRIYHQAMGNGQGALGIEDVLLALQEGRIITLILKNNFETRGAECHQCGALLRRAVVSCPYCSGPVEVGELTDALLEKAFRNGVHVRIVPDHPRYELVGGIAGLLRPAHVQPTAQLQGKVSVQGKPV